MIKFRLNTTILFIILTLALAVRLYKIDTPLADWHSWRQADTAAVAQNFAERDFNLLYPRYSDLGNVQTGQYNPEGYRFVEFPIYNSIFALLYKYFPVVPLHVYGRLVSIFFSLITIAIIYHLVRKEIGLVAAVSSAMVFSIFPFMVFYSRVVLPEMTALSMVFISIFFLYQWQSMKDGNKKIAFSLLSMTFAALSILVKPTAIFYFITLGYIFLAKYRLSTFRRPLVYIFFALAIVPFAAWRIWIGQFPEGAPGFEWLLTTVNTFEGQKDIFFRPAFFRWIFYERILELIMGGYAIAFTVLGILRKQKNMLFYSLGVSAIAFLCTFQGGNVQHDYYQTMILPPLAIFTGMGASLLFEKKGIFMNRILSVVVVIGLLGFSALMSFYLIRGNYNYSQELVNIGKIIETLTPPDSLIVTDRIGDTTLLYLANRRGIAATTDTLENLKQNHDMDYFVTENQETANMVKEDYELIFENERVFIFKL